MIILEPKEKPPVIFAEVPPVGRCAKQSASANRDLKIRGREGQDGDGSERGKLTRVPSCRQKQMLKMCIFAKDGDVNNLNFT